MYAEFALIRLHSSGQLWSNTALRDQDAGIAATMVNPSFLDLVNLALRVPVETIRHENARVFEGGEISQLRFETTESMLCNIKRGLSAHQ